MLLIRDTAAAEILEHGATIERKSTAGDVLSRVVSPSFRVLRDGQRRLQQIRSTLLMDPADRDERSPAAAPYDPDEPFAEMRDLID
jgi:hypothetical protein